jgi:lipopolysaccharide biosynthesis glycosyltransferase
MSPVSSNRSFHDPIRVILFVDENYARPLSVCIRSLLDNANPADVIAITVVAIEIGKETRAALTASWDLHRHSVEFVDLPAEPLKALPLRSSYGPGIIGGHLNHTVYACLLAPQLVGEDVHRAVLLDADTLVLGSLRPLHDHDLNGHAVGATVDAHIPTIGATYGVQMWRELGLDGDAPYINSGVIVADFDAWRAQQLTERALHYLNTYPDRVACFEQEALNAVLAGDVQLLDRRWNVLNFWALTEGHGSLGEKLLTDPIVRHFEAKMKPWFQPDVDFPHFTTYAEVDALCVHARTERGAPSLPWPTRPTADRR